MIDGDLLRLSLQIANGRDISSRIRSTNDKPKRRQVVLTGLRRKHRMNRKELHDYAMQPLQDREYGCGINERDYALLELAQQIIRECLRRKLLPTDTRWMDGRK